MRIRSFCNNFAYISGKSHRIFIKFFKHMYFWTRASSSNFGTHPHPDPGSDSGPYGTRSYSDFDRLLNIPNPVQLQATLDL